MSRPSERRRVLDDVAQELDIDPAQASAVIDSLEALERLQALLERALRALGPVTSLSVPEAALDASSLIQDPVALHRVLSAVEALLARQEELFELEAKKAREDMRRLVHDWLLASHRTRNQETLVSMLDALQMQDEGLGLSAI